MATKTVVADMKIDFPYNDDRLRAATKTVVFF